MPRKRLISKRKSGTNQLDEMEELLLAVSIRRFLDGAMPLTLYEKNTLAKLGYSPEAFCQYHKAKMEKKYAESIQRMENKNKEVNTSG